MTMWTKELGEEKEAEFEFVRACKLMPKDATVRKDLEERGWDGFVGRFSICSKWL